MKCTPYMFLGLHLEYIINGQSPARRNIQITGSSISSGKLFTKLENMRNLDENGTRFLSSEDMKKIASESTFSLLASVTRDSNYVDTGDEVSISNLINFQRIKIGSFDPSSLSLILNFPLFSKLHNLKFSISFNV